MIDELQSIPIHACRFCGSEIKHVETLILDEFVWDEHSRTYHPNGFTDIFKHTGNEWCAECGNPWSDYP